MYAGSSGGVVGDWRRSGDGMISNVHYNAVINVHEAHGVRLLM